jgi:hypothetical protein
MRLAVMTLAAQSQPGGAAINTDVINAFLTQPLLAVPELASLLYLYHLEALIKPSQCDIKTCLSAAVSATVHFSFLEACRA